MNDKRGIAELAGEERSVAHVTHDDARPGFLGRAQVLARAGAQVVERNDFCADREEAVDYVATDEPRAARDDDAIAREAARRQLTPRRPKTAGNVRISSRTSCQSDQLVTYR